MRPVSVSENDLATVAAQLGREPRGVLAISYYTPDGVPAVVMTAPRLPDGTPFPTLYYLTDPRLTAEASRQESAGVMKSMTARLAADPALAAAYRRAHESFLAERDAIESLGTDFSGGGMPDRVKCLHVLMAHALAKGPGLNPLGDEAVALAADRGLRGTAIPADWPAATHPSDPEGPVGQSDTDDPVARDDSAERKDSADDSAERNGSGEPR
ncbi:DUF501 domain-containing protein [Gordonia sinesedis]